MGSHAWSYVQDGGGRIFTADRSFTKNKFDTDIILQSMKPENSNAEAKRILRGIILELRRGRERASIIQKIVDSGRSVEEATAIVDVSFQRILELVNREKVTFVELLPQGLLYGLPVALLLVYIGLRVKGLYAFDSVFYPMVIAVGTTVAIMSAKTGKRGWPLQILSLSVVAAALVVSLLVEGYWFQDCTTFGELLDWTLSQSPVEAVCICVALGVAWCLPRGIGIPAARLRPAEVPAAEQ